MEKFVRSTFILPAWGSVQVAPRLQDSRSSQMSEFPCFRSLKARYYRPGGRGLQLARSLLFFVSIDQGSVSAASRPSLRLERLQISLREGISLLGEGHALPICAFGLDLGLLGKEDITSRVGHNSKNPSTDVPGRLIACAVLVLLLGWSFTSLDLLGEKCVHLHTILPSCERIARSSAQGREKGRGKRRHKASPLTQRQTVQMIRHK